MMEARAKTKPGREHRAHEWSSGPKRHEKGRPCEATLELCASAEQTGALGKVTMYAEEIGGVLLCEACRRKRVRLGIPAKDLTPKGTALSKSPKTPGFYLPNLREFREARGLSRRELAKQAGCHYKTLDKIENEKIAPSLGLCSRLAFEVGANLKDLRRDYSESSAEAGAA